MNTSKKRIVELWSVLSVVFLILGPFGIIAYKFLEKKEQKVLLETQKPLMVVGWFYVVMALLGGADNVSLWVILAFLVWGYIKLGNKKGQKSTDYGKMSYTGYFIVGAGVFIWLIALISNGNGSKLVSLYFMAGGLAILYLERTEQQKAGKFQQYLVYVLQQNNTSVLDLSLLFQNNPSDVVKDLEEMIKAGYFGDDYMDKEMQEIVFPHRKKADKAKQKRKVTVVCKHCGASNVITVGEHNVCEYCDLPITELVASNQ